MTRLFGKADPGDNPPLDHAATSITAEEHHGMHVRVLSVWSKALEPLGLWHDQLLAESLGKDGRGATPLTAVNTRDLHSRGQQHQAGRRDKLITNLLVDESGNIPLVIPARNPRHGRVESARRSHTRRGPGCGHPGHQPGLSPRTRGPPATSACPDSTNSPWEACCRC
ncbi:MAG: hypothetical protein Ct9H300mP1_20210 [Planctomycetaceae bacterium]|nr:MAG: hypothetical protein Ct9H300mP1_20210 [Planctomycetaceae bacterium]